MSTKHITVGPDHKLTSEKVYQVATDPEIKVEISNEAEKVVKESRKYVEKLAKNHKEVYGITTGFGNFKDESISKEKASELQTNLIKSHSAGVGDPLSVEVVRASMLIRLNSLALGNSGIRLKVLNLLKKLLNSHITPYVPSQGSVGASGDLAPLSHMGLILMGEGKAYNSEGELITGQKALDEIGEKSIKFKEKEGLAWNNGTSVMAGIAALSTYKAEKLLDLADLGCALTLEAILGLDTPFDQDIHKTRPHPGQEKVSKNIIKFTEGSELINSEPERIQDSYSVRCAPQVHGAIRDNFNHIKETVQRELNSVTDNPLIQIK